MLNFFRSRVCGVPQLQRQVAQIETLAQQAKNIEELQTALAQLLKHMDAVISEYKRLYDKPITV